MKRVGLLLLLVAFATYVHVSVATAQMKLNLEQAHILRELLKDLKIDLVTLPKEIAVGDPLPGGIQPSAMPPENRREASSNQVTLSRPGCSTDHYQRFKKTERRLRKS